MCARLGGGAPSSRSARSAREFRRHRRRGSSDGRAEPQSSVCARSWFAPAAAVDAPPRHPTSVSLESARHSRGSLSLTPYLIPASRTTTACHKLLAWRLGRAIPYRRSFKSTPLSAFFLFILRRRLLSNIALCARAWSSERLRYLIGPFLTLPSRLLGG